MQAIHYITQSHNQHCLMSDLVINSGYTLPFWSKS